MIKETGQGFIVSCYQLLLVSGRGIMTRMSNKNQKLCLTCLVGFSDLFEFLFTCAVQLPRTPSIPQIILPKLLLPGWDICDYPM